MGKLNYTTEELNKILSETNKENFEWDYQRSFTHKKPFPLFENAIEGVEYYTDRIILYKGAIKAGDFTVQIPHIAMAFNFNRPNQVYLQIINADMDASNPHTGWKIQGEFYSPNGKLNIGEIKGSKVAMNSRVQLSKGYVILWLCDFYFLTKQKDKIVIRGVQQKKFKDKLPSDFGALKNALYDYLSTPEQSTLLYEFQYLKLTKRKIKIKVNGREYLYRPRKLRWVSIIVGGTWRIKHRADDGQFIKTYVRGRINQNHEWTYIYIKRQHGMGGFNFGRLKNKNKNKNKNKKIDKN